MGGYADELSLKLTAKDEMSARLKSVQKELESVTRQMQTTSKELKDTGSPEAAAKLRDLEAEFRRLAKSQQEAARASKDAREALKKIQSEAGRSTTAMGRLGASITKHATAIRNAGLVAGAAMLLFAKQSISAFAEAEKQQMSLSTAMAKFPKLNDVTRQSFDDLNTSLMNLTGADDDALAAAEANLAMFDLTGSQIQKLIPLVNDYAIKSGKDLPEASTAIGRAMLGNAKALAAIGIKFKSTGDRGRDFGIILDALQQQVGGVGKAFGGTTAGQLSIANENFENLKESVGEALVPALQSAVNVVKPMVGYFTALDKPVKQVAAGITAVSIAALIAFPRLVAMNTALKTMGIGLGPVAAVLMAVITSVKGVNDVATTSTGPVDAFFAAIKSAAPPMLVPTIFAIGEAIGYVNHNLDKTPPSTNAATEAFKKQLRVQVLGTQANDQYADSLSKVTYLAHGATTATLGLKNALDKLSGAVSHVEALRAYRKALADFDKAPAKERGDSALAALSAFNSAAGTYKQGSKAWAAFVISNYARLKSAIANSGLSETARGQLVAPLEEARLKAIAVQRAIDLIHGKKIRIEYYGGTPTNPGGYATIDPKTGKPIKKKKAAGGAVFGPGSGTSDSIPAMLSNGEYVIRAAAAQRIGYEHLDRLNIADRMPSLPSIVNAPQITLPAAGIGRDAPLVGVMNVHPTSQIDFEMGLAREARRQDRDRRTRHARSGR